MSRCGVIVRVLVSLLAGGLIAASSAVAQSRGALLYATHCIACHTTEMHWRDKRSANSWASLKDQVRRWQDAASLAWSEGDILEVSRYLNDSIYHFEQTEDPTTSLVLPGDGSVANLARVIHCHPSRGQWAGSRRRPGPRKRGGWSGPRRTWAVFDGLRSGVSDALRS